MDVFPPSKSRTLTRCGRAHGKVEWGHVACACTQKRESVIEREGVIEREEREERERARERERERVEREKRLR